MRQFFAKFISKIYNSAKSNPYFRDLYYSVANSDFFSSFKEHEKMLGDRARVNTYHEAIQKHVNEDDVVIDLGTGTGILSLMAAKRNPKKIYAIEHGEIIETAKKVAAYNNIKIIDFVRVNSKSFNTNEKADIIIHEQIGAFLFDENMIDNILDLRDRVLKKNGKILPGKFEFFVEPVQLKESETVPFLWEQDIHGIKYDCLSNGEAAVGSYGELLIRPDSVEYFLGEPERLIYFDMETMDRNSISKKFEFRRKVLINGRLDGLIIYFNIIFDNEVNLSTSPFISKTHWNIPLLRTEQMKVSEGDSLKINFEMDDPADVSTYKWTVFN